MEQIQLNSGEPHENGSFKDNMFARLIISETAALLRDG
jgi:hypothetical protein